MKIATVGLITNNYETNIDPLNPLELTKEVVKFLKKDSMERNGYSILQKFKEKVITSEWTDWLNSFFEIEIKKLPVACSIKIQKNSPNEEIFFIKFLLPNGFEIGKISIQLSLKDNRKTK